MDILRKLKQRFGGKPFATFASALADWKNLWRKTN
jgi:hypothetical protein